ncbi:hypothetical protein FDK21_00560 [Cohaesibacter sp. CAU 1516]|uniref:efflux RND transporter permease subunit n=1 Tax=Cohaesibacter sp. CAU 1516 TaxID=2576038 RepID=UPI0010FE3363|nr:MMPL family transporter [Cohaesibacter sp. CAU 1516]TLP48195.1 hypothetical protein FDK21_00560 [Cohaesibacter sp. CAU 1516]
MQSLGLNKAAPKIASNAPLIAIIALAVTLLTTYLMVTQTRFTGDITDNLANDSESYRSFVALENRFRAFSQDELLLIKSADLSNPETYQAFQTFLLDLQFASQVEAAFSIFSLPDVTRATQTASQDSDELAEPSFFLTSPQIRTKPIAERLDALRQQVPLADKMLSEDLTVTLISLMTGSAEEGKSAKLTPESLAEIKALAAPYQQAFTLSFVGIPEIQRTIRDTLHGDQTKLTIASILLCVVVAGAIFRSWRGALICSVPPVTGVIWYFGFLALFSIPVDFLTTIVPTMVIVVAFADGVHLYMSIQRKRSDGLPRKDAIAYAITTTGPACFLASLTTSLAFIGIGLGGATTMERLSFTGAVGIMLAFLSVILIVPTLSHFLLKKGNTDTVATPPFLQSPGRPAIWLATFHRKTILSVACALSVGLIAIHIILPASFRVTDYLSEDLQIRKDEVLIEKKLGGSGQLYAILKDPDGQKGLNASDRETFEAILTSLNKRITKPIDPEPIVAMLQRFEGADLPEDNVLLSRFISKDGLAYLVPIPLGTMLAAEQISAYADGLINGLEADGLGDHVTLAGLSLLTAKETPNLISDLRTGLIGAIIIVILAIMLLVRSIRFGIAFLLPNLIPILTVEAYFWIVDKPLNMTAVIALTIAFGIAVDNSIHLLNQYRLCRHTNPDDSHSQAMARAIGAITPAVLATTMLLVAGLGMTQLSTLPSVALFGQLVITALFVALLADLYILPSFLLALEKRAENGPTEAGKSKD